MVRKLIRVEENLLEGRKADGRKLFARMMECRLDRRHRAVFWGGRESEMKWKKEERLYAASGEWILSGLIRTYKDTGSLCALNETREGYPCKGIPQDLVNRSKGATVCYPSKETKKEEKRNGEEVEKCAESRFLSLPTKRGTGLRVLEQSSFDQWGIRERFNEWINKFRYLGTVRYPEMRIDR